MELIAIWKEIKSTVGFLWGHPYLGGSNVVAMDFLSVLAKNGEVITAVEI